MTPTALRMYKIAPGKSGAMPKDMRKLFELATHYTIEETVWKTARATLQAAAVGIDDTPDGTLALGRSDATTDQPKISYPAECIMPDDLMVVEPMPGVVYAAKTFDNSTEWRLVTPEGFLLPVCRMHQGVVRKQLSTAALDYAHETNMRNPALNPQDFLWTMVHTCDIMDQIFAMMAAMYSIVTAEPMSPARRRASANARVPSDTLQRTRTVVLDLSKKRKAFISKGNPHAKGSRKPYHYCRSHFRRLPEGKHSKSAVVRDGVRVLRIAGHWRGDPNIGILHHDYKLK